MNKRLFFLSVCFLLSMAFLAAQTAEELEAVLDSPAITYSQAARFVLASVENDQIENAFEQAKERGWIPNVAAEDDPVNMRQLSSLMTNAFGIKGSLMNTIFPGPRYAYRVMISRSFIQGRADPNMRVSGERFLQILGNVLNAAGEEL
ncbi:MAG: hypothetical protein FWG99_04650 [Treponema sp.]|nr:hypothetical protein [Treponema sp.]